MDVDDEPEPEVSQKWSLLWTLFVLYCQLCGWFILVTSVFMVLQASGVIDLTFAILMFLWMLAPVIMIMGLVWWLVCVLVPGAQRLNNAVFVRSVPARGLGRLLIFYGRIVLIGPESWRTFGRYLVNLPRWLREDEREQDAELVDEEVDRPSGGRRDPTNEQLRERPADVRSEAGLRDRGHRRPPPIRVRSATPPRSEPVSPPPPIPGGWLEVPEPTPRPFRSPIFAVMHAAAAALTVTTARYWAIRILVVLVASIYIWPNSKRTVAAAVVLAELFFFLLSTPVRRSVLEGVPRSARLMTPAFTPFERFFGNLRTPRSPLHPVAPGESKLFDRDEESVGSMNRFEASSLAAGRPERERSGDPFRGGPPPSTTTGENLLRRDPPVSGSTSATSNHATTGSHTHLHQSQTNSRRTAPALDDKTKLGDLARKMTHLSGKTEVAANLPYTSQRATASSNVLIDVSRIANNLAGRTNNAGDRTSASAEVQKRRLQNNISDVKAISSPLSPPHASKRYRVGDRWHEVTAPAPTEVEMAEHAFVEALRPLVYELGHIARYAKYLCMATKQPTEWKFEGLIYQTHRPLELSRQEYAQIEAEDRASRAEIARLSEHGLVEKYQYCRMLVEGIMIELANARNQQTLVQHIARIDEANGWANDLHTALTAILVPLEQVLLQEEHHNIEVGLNLQLDELRRAFGSLNYDLNHDSLAREFQKLTSDMYNITATVNQHNCSDELRNRINTLDQEIRAAQQYWTTQQPQNLHLRGPRSLIRRLGQTINTNLLPSRTSSNAYLCSVYALVMSLHSTSTLDPTITAEDILSAMFTNFDRSQILLGRASHVPGIPTPAYQTLITHDAGIQNFISNQGNLLDTYIAERCLRLCNIEVQGLVFVLKFLVYHGLVDRNCRIAVVAPDSRAAAEGVYSVQYFDFAEDNALNFRQEQANLVWLYNDNHEGIARTRENSRRRRNGKEGLSIADDVAAIGHWEGFSRDRTLHNRALVERWGLPAGVVPEPEDQVL